MLADGGLHPRVASACSRRCRTCSRTLERTHDPANVARAVDAARAAGLRSASTSSTARRGSRSRTGGRSLAAAIALEPDHVSAYALVVEEGTKLAAQVRRGQVPAPEDDDEAAKYEIADERLAGGRLPLVRGQQLGPP